MNEQIYKKIKNICILLQSHTVDLYHSTNNPSTVHSNLMLRKLLLMNYLEYFKSTYSNPDKKQLFSTAIDNAIIDNYDDVINNLKSLIRN